MNDLMQPSSTAPAELRHRIQEFEDILLTHDQVDIPVTQYFCNGVYVREITIPAGTLITGKIHKHPCLSIVLTGEMEVITDEGPKVIKAPLVYESPAGVKRAGRALSDCRWLTIHPHQGDELDAEAMAKLLTVDTFAELLEHRHLEKISCQS
jgi:quercetin dioxygenase-like cupin family protein